MQIEGTDFGTNQCRMDVHQLYGEIVFRSREHFWLETLENK